LTLRILLGVFLALIGVFLTLSFLGVNGVFLGHFLGVKGFLDAKDSFGGLPDVNRCFPDAKLSRR